MRVINGLDELEALAFSSRKRIEGLADGKVAETHFFEAAKTVGGAWQTSETFDGLDNREFEYLRNVQPVEGDGENFFLEP